MAHPPEGCERIDLESFEFLFVVVELFEFCADDFTATWKEVTNITVAASNSENAKRGKIDFRIDSILLVYSTWLVSSAPVASS